MARQRQQGGGTRNLLIGILAGFVAATVVMQHSSLQRFADRSFGIFSVAHTTNKGEEEIRNHVIGGRLRVKAAIKESHGRNTNKWDTSHGSLGQRGGASVTVAEEIPVYSGGGGGGVDSSDDQHVVEGVNFRMFLGLKFCNVGWAGPDCSQRTLTPPCGPRDDRCFYHPDYGTAAVSRERWLGAQTLEEVAWDTRNTDLDRNEAHKIWYDGYSSLPQNLGDTVEVACGPYTQVKTILASGHEVDSLTLIDPGAFHYMTNVKRSSYKSGLLQAPGVSTTTVMSFPAERMPYLTSAFDTVVMINVIEHVQDAFLAFDNVYRMLRPGGLFIWHDRIWDAYTGKPGSGPRDGGSLREFQLHPVRLKTSFVERFTGVFDTVFDSRDSPELRRLKNHGIYFIGRKKLVNSLPSMAPATVSGSGLTVVLDTYPGSLRAAHLMQAIEAYHAMPIVRYIVLVLNGGAPQPFDLEPFASKVILKSFVTNSVSNHFRVSHEVLTEAVMVVDEDVEVKEALVLCMADQWSLDRERVIGMDARSMKGGESPMGEYPFVVGKTMLFHRRYLDAYLEDSELVEYMNPEGHPGAGELHFCEDMGMVALVAKATGKAPVAVRSGGLAEVHRDIEAEGPAVSTVSGVSTRKKECGQWLEQHFAMIVPTVSDQPICPGAAMNYQEDAVGDALPETMNQSDSEEHVIGQLLDALDTVVRSVATEKQIYGNIYNHAHMEQPLSYMKALREYCGPAKRICEIGFAGGHSATIFLHALPDAEYQAFDMWDRPFYEDAALAQVKKMFPTRQISIIKGDSTKTVPRYQGTCDIIHVDGAHHAQFPAKDLANMERLANPDGHILFVDDCATSFPAVLNAWKKMKAEGRVEEHLAEVPKGWSFRGKQKGWCIGEFVRSGSEKLLQVWPDAFFQVFGLFSPPLTSF